LEVGIALQHHAGASDWLTIDFGLRKFWQT
jgi:hypothetical protein